MTNSVEMSPVQKKLDCSAPDCKKTFVTQKNMDKYKEKFHQIVSALSQSLLVDSVGHFSRINVINARKITIV